jgi:hypothetical protein
MLCILYTTFPRNPFVSIFDARGDLMQQHNVRLDEM